MGRLNVPLLRCKDPNDEAVSCQCQDGEKDVEQSEEIMQTRFGLLETQPMFWDLFEVFGRHVPAEKFDFVIRRHSGRRSDKREIAFKVIHGNGTLYH